MIEICILLYTLISSTLCHPLSTLHPSPGAYPTPWNSHIPLSAHVLLQRATVSSPASPTPTQTSSGAKPGQIVVGSTKISTLDPEICGFVPYWNGSHSVLEIFGCPYYEPSHDRTAISYAGGLNSCTSSSTNFYCASTTPLTSCVALFYNSTVISYKTSYNTYLLQGSFSASTFPSVLTSIRSGNNYLLTTTMTTWIESTTAIPYPKTSYNSLDLTCTILRINDWPCQTLKLRERYTSYYCIDYRNVAPTGRMYDILDLGGIQTSLAGTTIILSSSVTTSFYTWTYINFVEMYTSKALPATTTSAFDASPSAYMNLIKNSPPSCVNAFNTSCTMINEAARRCWSEAFPPGPQDCFCELLKFGCPQICQASRDERIQYFGWTMDLCQGYIQTSNGTNLTFSKTWMDFDHRTNIIKKDLLPLRWTVQPMNQRGQVDSSFHCASSAVKLASFAMINGVVVLAIFVLTSRPVSKRLTFGFSGRNGSRLWPLIALIIVGLNAVANFGNAFILKGKPQFPNSAWDIKASTLALFWFTRPRLEWLITGLLVPQEHGTVHIFSGAAMLLSEFLLQILGTYNMVKVVLYGFRGSYFKPDYLGYIPQQTNAIILYTGALIWVLTIGFFFLIVMWRCIRLDQTIIYIFTLICAGIKIAFTYIFRGVKKIGSWILDGLFFVKWKCFSKKGPDVEMTNYGFIAPIVAASPLPPKVVSKSWKADAKKMGLTLESMSNITMTPVFLLLPFAGQWMFWVGFVLLYDNLYCPPQIWEMAGVWVATSFLSMVALLFLMRNNFL